MTNRVEHQCLECYWLNTRYQNDNSWTYECTNPNTETDKFFPNCNHFEAARLISPMLLKEEYLIMGEPLEIFHPLTGVYSLEIVDERGKHEAYLSMHPQSITLYDDAGNIVWTKGLDSET